eukprot:jgi/Galph1/2869/GphlegSOOS_G1513.1
MSKLFSSEFIAYSLMRVVAFTLTIPLTSVYKGKSNDLRRLSSVRKYKLKKNTRVRMEMSQNPLDALNLGFVKKKQVLGTTPSMYETGEESLETTDTGGVGGVGGIDNTGRGGRGSGWSGDGSQDASFRGEPEGAILALLNKYGISWDSIASDVRKAYESGWIGEDVLRNYILATSHPISRMRNRFLADERFLLKILIEESLGLCGKLSAEWERRRERFWKEVDFVFANVVMAFLADFALVYFPAPVASLMPASHMKTSWITSFSKSLPGSVFQAGQYTFGQRASSYCFKVSQLALTGFCCSFIGVALTNSIILFRKAMDPSFTPENQMSNVLTTSAAYGVFLGLSAGTRYQLVNGIEQHIFPRMFHAVPGMESLATFLLRWGNTFWGSQQWVMFAKFTGVQKSSQQKKKG